MSGLSRYAVAGVDEAREQEAFATVMRPWLARTAIRNPRARKLTELSSGLFASVIKIDDLAVAVTTDGVGTKMLTAQQTGRYDTVGVDCVANNVNDLVCVGADPIALLDYIATSRVDEDVFEQIARGLFVGAEQAGISIPGGEIAQMAALFAQTSEGQGPHLDLVGTAIGVLPKASAIRPLRIVDGSAVQAGDLVIGLPSSGLHSNGYSLARAALANKGADWLDQRLPGDSKTIADVLLAPTRIYVDTFRALWEHDIPIHGAAHISGGGLLNVLRLATPLGFSLQGLPGPSPLFEAIKAAGDVPIAEMYSTFNMGVGMCIVISPKDADRAFGILDDDAMVIGEAIDMMHRYVRLPQFGLRGIGESFQPV